VPQLIRLAVLGLLLLPLVGCPNVTTYEPDEVEGDEAGECADEADNDGDELIDCEDDGCATAPDCTNDPPEGAVVKITPTSPVTGDDLLCSLDEAAVDPEGTEVSYAFGWSLDGELTSIIEPAIPADSTARGEVWTCLVVASDEDGVAAEPAEASVAIGNTPPTGPMVQITPDLPQVTDDLSCNIDQDSTDQDEDQITYFFQWLKNGVPAGPPANQLPAVYTQVADTWTCLVTPTDGFHSGPSGEAAVTIRVDSFPHSAAGEGHTCSVQMDGSYACWGDDSAGQSSGPMDSYFKLAAGPDYTCGLRFGDTGIDCWGNVAGDLANIPEGTFIDIDLSDTHACAVASAGYVEAWGSLTDTPEALPAAPTHVAAANDGSCCALLDGGALFCWSTEPLEAPEGTWHDVDAGGEHYCAAGALGLHCWGDDTYGQVSETPTSAGPWEQVSAGWRHSCAIDLNTGFVTCWGDDTYGQATPPTGEFNHVAAGWYHTCGKRPNDTVECWGCIENDLGQCSPVF
jgi:hypothetical protein